MTYEPPKRRAIRLDDDVWKALRELGESPNKFLRRILIDEREKQGKPKRDKSA